MSTPPNDWADESELAALFHAALSHQKSCHALRRENAGLVTHAKCRDDAIRVWFLQRLSDENCINTIVDVFTEIRTDLEDVDSFRAAIDAAIAATKPGETP